MLRRYNVPLRAGRVRMRHSRVYLWDRSVCGRIFWLKKGRKDGCTIRREYSLHCVDIFASVEDQKIYVNISGATSLLYFVIIAHCSTWTRECAQQIWTNKWVGSMSIISGVSGKEPTPTPIPIPTPTPTPTPIQTFEVGETVFLSPAAI